MDITVDIKSAIAKLNNASDIMQSKILVNTITATGASLRKDFQETVAIHDWDDYAKVTKNRRGVAHKYSYAAIMLRYLIRFRTTIKKGNASVTVGAFAGKAGSKSKNLSNASFKIKYGMTLAAFVKILTYGGRIKITPTMRKEMVAHGLIPKSGTTYLEFPKRNWFTTTPGNSEAAIRANFMRHFAIIKAKYLNAAVR
jgi:hypothetical protein